MDASHSIYMKNSVNASIGSLSMLIGPRVLKSLNNIEKLQPRMMVGTFNGDHSATIICFSLTNVSKETDLIAFYYELSYLVRSIPKHNALDIGGDMRAQIGKNVNPKLSLNNSSNIKGQHLTDFTLEHRLTCLNTTFLKREGKQWISTYANNTKAQKDYVFIDKKWNNSALNCQAYFSFQGVSSAHRIFTVKIRLSLLKNVTRTTTIVHYDWTLLNNRHIREKYTLRQRN